MAQLCRSYREGNLEEASKLHYRLLPLAQVMFCETNPIPVKEAVHMIGKMTEEIRLPLTRLTETKRDELERVMKEMGLIKGN
jgi:4-hydroxy-tetrahydrodipicolinate synthase